MPREKKTILAIDDDELNLKLIKNILEETYNVITTTSGYLGLDILEIEDIDIILLDIVMPEINGFELIKKIYENEEYKNIPIIFITANDSNENLKKAFSLGGKDYIRKPFRKEQLEIRIDNQIKTIELTEDLKRKEQFYETILNMQSNMIIVVNKKEVFANKITFANKTFLEFFGLKDLNDLEESNIDIYDLLVQNEKLFCKDKNNAKQTWIEDLLKINEHSRNVGFLNKNNETNIFRTSITKFEEYEYILSFTDISETLKTTFDLEKK